MDPLNRNVTEALRSWRIQLEAGINTQEALELAGRTCPHDAEMCFRRAARRAAEGDDIKSVLSELSTLLPEGERATIAAGWSAGRAEAALDSVVAQRLLWFESRRRIMLKMIWPLVALLIASFVAPVPGLAKGNYGLMAYLIMVAVPIATFGVAAILGSVFLRNRALERVWNADGTPRAASSFDQLMLQLPLCSHIEVQRSLAEFGSLLSNLISAGVPISQGLQVAARTMRNGSYRESVVRMSNDTADGRAFTAAMRDESEALWPREFSAAMGVAERAGTLDATLAHMAANARERYTRAVEQFSDWLPRVLYGIIAMFIIWNIIMMGLEYFRTLGEFMKEIP